MYFKIFMRSVLQGLGVLTLGEDQTYVADL